MFAGSNTGSDIDLTLYGDKLTHSMYLQIVETLDELLLPYMIDLSIFEELHHANLEEHIQRVGVVFYERDNFLGNAMQEQLKY
jgi:uncharacterized protein